MPCPLCDDTGWKPAADNSDRVHRVLRCDCWRDAMTAKALEAAGIPKRYEGCTLEQFVIYDNERLVRAIEQAKRFAAEFPNVTKGLFLVGPPGIGKSHIAVAVLKQIIRTTGARGLFYDVRELLKLIRSTYNPLVKTAEMDVLRPVMSAEILVLDDIGAEKTSEWVEETLNLIVNSRYNDRLPTIFTSNHEEKEDHSDPDSLLVRVGFRMHSRLYEMCDFLEFDGADFRHAPPNATERDLLSAWKNQRRPARLPGKSSGQARAQLRDGKGDLKWTGGRAGS